VRHSWWSEVILSLHEFTCGSTTGGLVHEHTAIRQMSGPQEPCVKAVHQ